VQDGRDRIGVDIVCGETEFAEYQSDAPKMTVYSLGSTTEDVLAGQSKPSPDVSVQLGEVVVDTDIWRITNLGLWHSEVSLGCSNTDRSRKSDSTASAHWS